MWGAKAGRIVAKANGHVPNGAKDVRKAGIYRLHRSNPTRTAKEAAASIFMEGEFKGEGMASRVHEANPETTHSRNKVANPI